MSKIALVVEFDVKPEHRAAFEALMKSHAAKTLEAEKGCLAFEVLIPREGDGKVFLYECYAGDDALKEHIASPILADTRARYKDMIADRRITVCTVA